MRSPGSEDVRLWDHDPVCEYRVVDPSLVSPRLLHSPTPPNFTRTHLRVLNIPSLVEEDARIAAGLRGGITGRWTPTHTPE